MEPPARGEPAVAQALDVTALPVRVVADPRRSGSSGAVIGVGLAMAAGAVLLASAFFPLATISLTTSADGRSLESDAQVTLVLAFFAIAGSVGLFFVASKQLPDERGWAIAALAGGAGVGSLIAQVMHGGANELAAAPLHNGRTVVVWPYAPGVALLAVVALGGAIAAGVRRWPMGAAASWLGCGLLAAMGVALALFSSWTISSAARLRSLAATRAHEVPGLEIVVALLVLAMVARVLRRRVD